jgi:hypothetical protein
MLALIEAHPLEPAEIQLKAEERKRGGRPMPTRQQTARPRQTAEHASTEDSPRKRERRPLAPRSAEGSETKMPRRNTKPPRNGEQREPRERARTFTPRPPVSRPAQAGDKIEAVLLEERTKKGGWRAAYPQNGLQGPIVNPGLVPSDKGAGDTLTLLIHSINRFEMAFRVPTEADFAEKKPRKKGGA